MIIYELLVAIVFLRRRLGGGLLRVLRMAGGYRRGNGIRKVLRVVCSIVLVGRGKHGGLVALDAMIVVVLLVEGTEKLNYVVVSAEGKGDINELDQKERYWDVVFLQFVLISSND